MYHANIDGVCSKVRELRAVVKKDNAHVVAITEMFSKVVQNESEFPEGYTRHWRKDRRNRWGGGVGVLVRDIWCVREMEILD